MYRGLMNEEHKEMTKAGSFYTSQTKSKFVRNRQDKEMYAQVLYELRV